MFLSHLMQSRGIVHLWVIRQTTPSPPTADMTREYSIRKQILNGFGLNGFLSFWYRFVHPRFGPIKCIRTLRSVQVDEELMVSYGYNHESTVGNGPEAPDWYKQDLEEFQQKQSTVANQ